MPEPQTLDNQERRAFDEEMRHQQKRRKLPRRNFSRAELFAAWDALADGKPHAYVKRGHNKALPGLPPVLNIVDAFHVISPFYIVERPDPDTVVIRVNQELRALVDDYRIKRNAPEITGVGSWARRLYAELTRRKEEFYAQKKKLGWTADSQHWRIYQGIVAWIESELAKVAKDD